MTVDLNVPLLNKYKEEMKDENGEPVFLGKVVEDILFNNQDPKKNAQKLAFWGYQIMEKKVLEMDKSDYQMFKDVINESKMIALWKDQILSACKE